MADGDGAATCERLRWSEPGFDALPAGRHGKIANAGRGERRVHKSNRLRPKLGLMPERGLQGELRQLENSEHL